MTPHPSAATAPDERRRQQLILQQAQPALLQALRAQRQALPQQTASPSPAQRELALECTRYAALCAHASQGESALGMPEEALVARAVVAGAPGAFVPQLESACRRLAYYDPLTGLPNRGLLQDRLAAALISGALSGRYGALFFINVDNFRELNSAEGHDAGDRLLVLLAARLRSVAGAGDCVARKWGDEFLILVEDLGGNLEQAMECARQLGDRLFAAMAPAADLKTLEYPCRLRVAAALFQAGDTVETVFRHARFALQQAKEAGRNTLCFFDDWMQSSQEQRSALSAELEKALLWRQFRLYYQPQVDSARRVLGVEALLRWPHPLRGLVPPNEFIPLAEQSHLISLIGLWVLKTACGQLKKWETDPLCCTLQMAVNVIARQFQQDDFVDQVAAALRESGANPQRLKLELTESLVLENIDEVIGKMNQIRALGVCFSMDDFGTGYSSLAYLANLPIDQLKIDKSFVQNSPGTTSDETIVRTIIAMGQGLGMNVIAEGVETVEQRAFLAQHGCHAYQGYLFSRPLPLDALQAYLGEHRALPDGTA